MPKDLYWNCTSKCQGGETCDRQGSQSLVPILFFADDDADFALSMGRINMGQRTVTDERLVSVHCEELMLGSGKVLRIPCLDCFERQDALPQITVDHRIIAPVDHCSQTLGGKLVGGVVAHP